MNLPTKAYFLPIVFLLISGCETAPKIDTAIVEPNDSFDLFASADCCESIENINIEPIAKSATVNFSLSENPKKLKTGDNRSFYRAFEISEEGRVLDYNLRTFITKNKQTKERFALMPIVAVLNEDLTISRTSSLRYLSYNQWTVWGQQEHFNLYIRINKNERPKEKYILVITPESLLGKGYVYQSGGSGGSVIAIPTGDGTIFVPSGGSPSEVFTVSPTPTGILSLEHITNPLNKPLGRLGW